MQGDDPERPTPPRARARMGLSGPLPPPVPVPDAGEPVAPGPAAPQARRPAKMTLGMAPGTGIPKPAPGDDVPRASRLGPIKLGGGAESVVRTGYVPRAVSPKTWSTVPSRLEAEVLERVAVLTVRGILPEEGVGKALAQALDDEALVEAEYATTFDWAVARSILPSFPAPFRDVDHRPSPTILAMAGILERYCVAELSQPGTCDRPTEYFSAYLESFGLSKATLAAICDAYHGRLAALRAALPAPVEEGEPAAAAPAVMFGWEDEYEGLMRP